MARNAYCNNTADLQAVYPNLNELQENRIVEDWTVYSGSVYRSNNTGYVAKVFQDSVALTASVSLVAISAGKFYYDSTNDILYIQTTNSSAPDNFDITIGVDWDAYSLQMTKNASEEIDGYLGALFPVPIPKSVNRLAGYAYDYNLVRACALLTVHYLLYRIDPILSDRVKNDSHNIINKYLKGELKFSWDASSGKNNSAVIVPRTTNVTSSVIPRVTGYYGGSTALWVVKITTAGAIGTAYFKVSYDNGANYNGEAILTSVEWSSIGSGIYIKWETDQESAGTLTLNDLYYIQVTGQEEIRSTKISTIQAIV